MRVVVVGRRSEIGGFAVAGVETSVCETAADAETVVRALGGAGTDVGLLVLSSWAAAAAARAVEALRKRRGPPVVAALPEPEGGDG